MRHLFVAQRTSFNGFVISSPVAVELKRRAFQLARVQPYDERLADGIQVLRYETKQAYVPHKVGLGQSAGSLTVPAIILAILCTSLVLGSTLSVLTTLF